MLGTFFFDFFAGSATAGFGVMGQVRGTGMFFVYMIGYFNALIVILPILLIRRFGVGAAAYLFYFFPGSLVNYYYEWIKEPVLISPWAAFGWELFGPLAGLSADLVYRLWPAHERARAVAMGLVLGLASFVLTLIALLCFYQTPMATDAGSFWGLAYFGLPWLLVNSGFGGYTAYAIARGS